MAANKSLHIDRQTDGGEWAWRYLEFIFLFKEVLNNGEGEGTSYIAPVKKKVDSDKL